MSPSWTPGSFVDEAIAKIKEAVPENARVICGLSGGVDSSVAAVLCHRALGRSPGLHLRRQRPAARRRVRERDGDDAPALSLEPDPGRRPKAVFGRAQRRHRSGKEAQDHRARVHRRVRRARRARRECAVSGAGHALPGRHRERQRQGSERRHQEPPQRGRPARAHEAQADRAAARAVQRRGAPRGRGPGHAARRALPAAVSGSRAWPCAAWAT